MQQPSGIMSPDTGDAPSSDRFVAIFAGFEAAILELDESGTVVAANERFCELVGRSPDQVLGATPPFPWWAEHDRAWLAAQLGDSCEHAAARGRFSARLVCGDGHRQVVASTSVVVAADGRRLVITMRDAEALGRAKAALLRETVGVWTPVPALESNLRRLFESNIIGIISGQDDRVLEANDAFLGMIGYSRADLEAGGLDWASLTPPEWHEADATAGATMFRTGVSGPIEKQYFTRGGGRVWVRIAGAVVEWEPFRWVSFVEDVTDQLVAEQARDRAEAERDRLLAELAETNGQLQTALDTRIVIEQAKGWLARDLSIPVDEAFKRMRHYARNNNVTVRSVAHAIMKPGTPAQDTRTNQRRP